MCSNDMTSTLVCATLFTKHEPTINKTPSCQLTLFLNLIPCIPCILLQSLLRHAHSLSLFSAGLHKWGASDGRAEEDFDWDTAANDCPTSRTAQAGHGRDRQAVYDTEAFKFQNLARGLNGTSTQIMSAMSRTDKMCVWYHLHSDSGHMSYFGVLPAAGMRNWNVKNKQTGQMTCFSLSDLAWYFAPEPVVSFKLSGV